MITPEYLRRCGFIETTECNEMVYSLQVGNYLWLEARFHATAPKTPYFSLAPESSQSGATLTFWNQPRTPEQLGGVIIALTGEIPPIK